MRLKSISLTNWLCFRGDHRIALEAGVHAVVARHEDDENRSNWLGKSSFLRAIRFLLEGRRPKGCKFEDDWITGGEMLGRVVGEYDNGLTVTRERPRGGPTVLTVSWVEDGEIKNARGDSAQSIIDKHTGVDDYDFSFFEQKGMASLIEATPGVLFKQASSWFGLEKIEDGQAILATRLSGLLNDHEKLQSSLLECERTVDAYDADAHRKKSEAVIKLESGLTEVREMFEHARTAESRRRAAEDLDALRLKSQRLREEMAKVDSKALKESWVRVSDELATSKVAANEALRKLNERRNLVAGNFDGVCPLTCDECPVKADVQLELTTRAHEVTALEQDLDAKRLIRDATSVALEEIVEEISAYKALKSDYTKVKERASLLSEQAADDDAEEDSTEESIDEIGETLSQLERDVVDAKADVRLCERMKTESEKAREELTDLKEQLADLEENIELHKAAVEVWRVSKRKVAEAALREIEHLTNSVLTDSSIDLAVEVSWSREHKNELAAQCDRCGASFPKSKRVKKCERCGVDRGAKIIDELTIEPSNTSGAADDLTGIAFKLAVAAWRRSRTVNLSVATLDEPLAYVDEANKKAFAAHIVSMLSSQYGFSQSFVTAHDRAVLETLPRRVEIIAGKEGSRFA